MKNLKCVKAWVREFPSITGQDAFELKKYVIIDYWKEIEKKYEEFINYAESAKEPIVLPVIGEWGVGKTSSFKSILIPLLERRGYIGLKIKAKNFFNYFKKFVKLGLMNIEEAIVRALIVAIFKTYDIIYSDDESTIKLLKKIFSEFKTDKIFIYIDEFEDIVEVEEASLILDGIASLVSGEYGPLSAKGEFRGRVHIILSLTPQAYSRISSEVKETFGRIRRRMKGEIELRPVTREEAYEFALGYFRYIYNREPEELPLSSESIIDTLYKASNGNLGYMTQFLNSILSRTKSNKCDDGYITIDAEELVSSLGKEKIVEMGIEREAIRIERIKRLYERILSKQTESRGEIRKVLFSLAISPYPITIEQLKFLTGLSWDYIHSGLLKIEYSLTEYRKPILKFNVFSEIDVKKVLSQDVIKGIADKIGMDKEKVEEDIDRILKHLRIFRYKAGKLEGYIAVPIDEIVEEEVADEIWEREGAPDKPEIIIILSKLREICKEINVKTKAYKFPDAIINTIFPPRCIICQASKSINEGYKIWRETINEISSGEINPIDLGESLIPLLIPEFLTSPGDYKAGFKGLYRKVFAIRDKSWQLKFLSIGILNRSLVVDTEFVKFFKNLLLNVPLVILFTKRELTKDAEKLSKRIKEAFIKVIPLGLQEIAILHGLKKLKSKSLLREPEAKRLIIMTREMLKFDIKGFIEEIMRELDERGIILRFPEWPSTGKVSDLPSVYDYYLVYPYGRIDRNRLFKWIEENIRKRKIFGVKRRDYPCGVDIETQNELEVYEDKLRHEGFLRRDIEGFILISNNKIETRLLDLIEEKGEVPIKYLLNKFVSIVTSESEIIDMLNLYLETLRRKGYIEVYSGIVKYLKYEELERKARRMFETLWKEYEHLGDGKKFDMILVAKRRAYNFFSVNQILNTLRELMIGASIPNDLDRRRVLKSLIRLSEHFLRLYLSLVLESFRISKELKRAVEAIKNEIDDFMHQLIRYLKIFGVEIVEEDIEEYIKVKNLLDEFYEIWNSPADVNDESFLFKHKLLVRKDELYAEDSRLNPDRYEKLNIAGQDLYIIQYFFFTRIENTRKIEGFKKAYFLNPKYYLLHDKYENVKAIYFEMSDALRKIKDYTKRIEKLINEKKMLERFFEERLGNKITLIIKHYKGEHIIIEQRRIKLREIIAHIESIYSEIRDLIKKIERAERMVAIINDDFYGRLKLIEPLIKNILEGNVPEHILAQYGIKNVEEIKEAVNCANEILSKLKKVDKIGLEDLLEELEKLERIDNLLPKKGDILSILKEVQALRDGIIKKINEWIYDLKTAKERGLPESEFRKLIIELEMLRREVEKRRGIAKIYNRVEALEEKINELLIEYMNPIAEAVRSMIKTSKEINLFDLINKVFDEINKRGFSKEREEVILEVFKQLERLGKEGKIVIIVKKQGK